MLSMRSHRLLSTELTKCAQLYTHCEDVEAINVARLAELPGEPMRFAALDSGRTEALTACQVRLLWGPSHVLPALAVSCFIAGGPAYSLPQ
jgi:hypothetical protein